MSNYRRYYINGGTWFFTVVAVHKKRERDPKKMRHRVVSHFK